MKKKRISKGQSLVKKRKCTKNEKRRKGATPPFKKWIRLFILVDLPYIQLVLCENTNWNVEIEIVYQLYL
jgi:hypothetical protein